MEIIQWIKDFLSDFKTSELLLVCLLLNALNLAMIYNLGRIKKYKPLVFLAGLLFLCSILLTVYIIFLGIQYAKQ